MTFFYAVIFGLIQGFGEFLPISSSGHLVLANKIFGIDCNFVFFSVFLHLATLLAIFIVMWRDIYYLILHPFSKLAQKLYIATIPTVLIVIFFNDTFESAFSGAFLPISFLITAFILVLTEILAKKQNFLSIKTGFIMGFVQGLAIFPGISRSGSTICAGLLCGANREETTKFSFLMSIPIIIGSMLFELWDCFVNNLPLFDTPLLPTITAFLVAFLTGIISIKFMLDLFKKIKLWYFSIYLIFVAMLSLLFL